MKKSKMYKKIPANKKLISSHAHKPKADSGFTIIETLIALIIFSIAITGVITVADQGGVSTTAAKNRVTAAYLADEGIELMRAMRDNLVLSNPSAIAGWDQFVSATIGGGGTPASCSAAVPCDIDGADTVHPANPVFPKLDNFTACGTAVVGATGLFCPLYYDDHPSGTGFYGDQQPYAGITRTIFSRALTVTSASNPDAVTVTSQVVWREGQTTQSIIQTENLYDWYSS